MPDGGSGGPTVSVITPSYNQGEFLARTLESVLSQEGVHLEYLVFDGGSTDDSVAIIERYSDHLDFWVSEPDRGQSHAINKGFTRATGDIVTWLNSDDVLLPGALRTVVEAFRRDPTADAVYGNFVYIDRHDRVLRKRRVFKSFRYETLLYHDYLGQPAVFYRRRVLDRIGLLDEDLEYSMDWDFFLRMKRACRMIHVGAFLAGYRLHDEAKTSQEGEAEYSACLRSIFERNKPQIFGHPTINALYLSGYKWVSRGLRLYTVLRDNPVAYWRTYRHVTGDRWLRGLAWRWKH